MVLDEMCQTVLHPHGILSESVSEFLADSLIILLHRTVKQIYMSDDRWKNLSYAIYRLRSSLE